MKLAVILAALLMLTTGAPAQRPEPMTGGFDPEDVLSNLEQRIQERDWIRYADFLAADFRFVPFSQVPQEYPTVDWDAWGRKEEIRFIEELVSPSQTATLNLHDKILDKGRESQGRAEWDLVYTLTYSGQAFQSRAIMVFEKVDNLWFLLEWIDTTMETEEDTGSPIETSGTLRGALSR
jgi:hypothetical protein